MNQTHSVFLNYVPLEDNAYSQAKEKGNTVFMDRRDELFRELENLISNKKATILDLLDAQQTPDNYELMDILLTHGYIPKNHW